MQLIRPSRLAVLVATLGTAWLAVPGPAEAGPLEQDHWSESVDGMQQPCGFDIRVQASYDGRFLMVRHGDGLAYAHENVSVRVTYTGVETGLTMSEFAQFHFQDLKVVDNGDGTLTITSHGSGPHRVVGADGKVMFIESRSQWWTQTIDDGGTPSDPGDDELISATPPFKVVGNLGGEGRDFCTDLTAQVG
jgi:hypothetical protein